MVAELLRISVLLKVNLKLKTWWGLLEKQTFIGVMQAFLGTFWSCHGKNLLRQHRLARALLMLRTLQVVATFWLLALVYSRGECSLAAQPVVVLLALATMGAFTLTFLVVAADEIGMAWFAVNFFPLFRVARWEVGVGSQIWRGPTGGTSAQGAKRFFRGGSGGIILPSRRGWPHLRAPYLRQIRGVSSSHVERHIMQPQKDVWT